MCSQEVQTITRKTFDPVGHCIYCGGEGELTREHIIPHALNGDFVLPEASCKPCAAKTSKFERYVLRGPMWPVRAHLGLRSRRKLAPKNAPLTYYRGEETFNVSLPLAEHPLMLTFPIFAPPSIVTNASIRGISMRGQWDFGFGKPIQEVLRNLKASRLQIQYSYKIVPFAQLLGKIAWSMAAAQRQLSRIDRSDCLLRSLVDDPDDIGRWVGTFTDNTPGQRGAAGVLHSIIPREDHDRGLYVTEVQLFADSGAPRYAVVLGRLR